MMKKQDEFEPVEVFSGNLWEAEMVKNLLENEGIEAFINNEFTGTLAPWYTAGGGAGSVSVVVSAFHYVKAKVIVEEFERNRREEK
jgi:hypothetical protein